MNYSQRVRAARYLYRRCHHRALDDEDTLLALIEDSIMAGMHRHFMSHQIAIDDWLTKVMDYKRSHKETIDELKLKNDEIRRSETFQQ